MRRPTAPLALAAALVGAACGREGTGDAGADPWLAPYAQAATGEGGGWPGLEVEVSVATFQQDYRLREFVPPCTLSPVAVLPDSVGPLRAGQTLGQLTALCPQMLRGWDWGYGGMAIPAAAVALGGSIAVVLLADTLPTSPVGQVATGELSTPEGFGAGSPIEDLIETLGGPELIAADCSLELTFATRPGLSFVVELPPEAELECGDFPELARDNAVDRLPPGTLVRYVVQFRITG